MQLFITSTDTDIGKTLVSSWLCTHTGYEYFKPIQTGSIYGTDSQTIKDLTDSKVHKESYSYKASASPHIAAKAQNEIIDIKKIKLPNIDNLIVEGAGGVLVPVNNKILMIDLIKHFNIPTIIVTNFHLGTINHTLLTIEALRARNIKILGLIITGELNTPIYKSIEYYGKINILAQLPYIKSINKRSLRTIKLSTKLDAIFK